MNPFRTEGTILDKRFRSAHPQWPWLLLIFIAAITVTIILKDTGHWFLAIMVIIAFVYWANTSEWFKSFKTQPEMEPDEEKAARKKREAEDFHARNKQIIQQRDQQRKTEPMPVSHANTSNNDPWLAFCIEIEGAWARGDYDWARQQLQKIAYGMVGESVTDEQRKNFTQLMTEFAKEDPLYKEIMERVIPLVQANPGMLQSQIYKGQPDHIKEQMRYVLYFANELGHIKRIKKGNSYKLLLPEG
ncbi:MAG: hypothetical protein PHH47_12965 [Gallionella sp.]|nr:hypothetical protein [Gallionella sp.]MDD4947599.1 hypothetical protein [Gallionella sp.]